MKTYANRGRAAPLNHSVYETFTKTLGLDSGDFSSLSRRGLSSEQILIAGYATKPTNKASTTQKALAKVVTEYSSIDGVPGFYEDDKTGHMNCHGISGIAIPVRDINGYIHSLLIRNANPTTKNGRVVNKYMQFSTGGRTKGGKAWQITHCPIIKGKAEEVAGTEIRLTEGVLKADITTALGQYYCLGVQGLKSPDDLPIVFEELQVSTVRICLDAGEDDATDMIRAKAQLIKTIQTYGADVVVELWDQKYGKGIDDVIASGNEDKIRIATDIEIEQMLEAAHDRNPNNGEWVYCIEVKRFVHIDKFTELDDKQFCVKFMLEKQENINRLLASGFPQVDKLTFSPGQEKFLTEEGYSCLNVWTNPNIEPIEGDVTPFINHLNFLFPAEGDRNILLDWMAWQVQHPGDKILWALLIKGEEGIGKSFFGKIMKLILGEKNVSKPTNEMVHEPYTGWQKYASLIVIEEMMGGGRMDLMNKLKPMITDETTQIREMHKQAYEQPNRFNMMMFTNYENPIIITKRDRRYAILKSEVLRQDPEYYTKLWDWAKEEGTAPALLHYLMRRDLSHFNPKAEAPKTSAKAEMIMISRTSLEEWIQVGVEERAWPFQLDIISIRHLKTLKNAPLFVQKISDYKIAEALKSAGAKQYPNQIEFSDGSRSRVWILRRYEMYENEGAEYIRKKFEEGTKFSAPLNPMEELEPL